MADRITFYYSSVSSTLEVGVNFSFRRETWDFLFLFCDVGVLYMFSSNMHGETKKD